MLTFRHLPQGGTGVLIYDDQGEMVCDTTTRPIRVKKDADLAVFSSNYEGDLAIYDDAGIKVVWTEDGVTHVDESGDLEVFE